MCGWELLFEQINTLELVKADIIVATVHWYINCNTKLWCIGRNDILRVDGELDTMEKLPENWNQTYPRRLSYIHDNQMYILSAQIFDDDAILFSFRNHTNGKVTLFTCAINETVNDIAYTNRNRKIYELIPNIDNLMEKLKRELIQPHVLIIYSGLQNGQNGVKRDLRCSKWSKIKSKWKTYFIGKYRK